MNRTLLEAARGRLMLSHAADEMHKQLAVSRRLIEESHRLLATASAYSPLIYGARPNSAEDKREA